MSNKKSHVVYFLNTIPNKNETVWTKYDINMKQFEENEHTFPNKKQEYI